MRPDADSKKFKNIGNALNFFSLFISLITILLILNWFFGIMPIPKLQGLPLLMAPLIGIFGLALNFISVKYSQNKYTKLSIAINCVLLVLPFLYIFLGTLIQGV